MQVPFVDLHCHLLPGVDDGARDLEEALAYAERIARLGVTELTVTPHVHPVWLTDPLEIPPRAAALQAALDRAAVGVTVHPGGELHHTALPGLTARPRRDRPRPRGRALGAHGGTVRRHRR
jgi:protein-tyrosine phosphatase